MNITSEQLIISSSTSAISIFGLIFNAMALFLLFRLPELRNAFGYMCTSHIISNIAVLFCFLFWGVPMTLTKSAIAEGSISKGVSAVALLCWEVSIYSHVFVALNRFIAIYMPIQYMAHFGKYTAFVFILLSWIIATLYVSPFLVEGCGNHYTTDSYVWLYDETPCSQWISKWLDFYSSCFWVFVIAIFDILNAIKIIKMWKKLNISDSTTQRKRREIIFFAQAFCQNILFALATFCFHCAVYWVSNTTGIFFLTTFLWGAVHAIDGLILVLFNIGMHRRKIVANLNNFLKRDSQLSTKVSQHPQSQLKSNESTAVIQNVDNIVQSDNDPTN